MKLTPPVLAATMLLCIMAGESRSLAQESSSTIPAVEEDAVAFELRMQRMIQQLQDADRTRRDEAERQLSELGESVIPWLPDVRPDTAAELKERIARIRRSVEQASIADAMKPSRVEFTGELSLAEVLQGLEKQTGNRIIDFRNRFGQQPSTQSLKLDLPAQDFWPAFDRLLDQAGLTTYGYTGEPRTLGVVAAGDNHTDRYGNATYSGIFRLAASEILARRNLREPSKASLQIRLEVLWEPRVLPILLRQPYRDLELTDDQGNSIPVASPDGVAEAPIQSTVAGIDLILPLQLPDRSVKSIAKLKGRLTALVPGREETFEFEDLAEARNVSKQRGGLEVTLERVRKNGAVHECRIRLKLLNREDSFQSHLDWASNNVVYLINADGERIDNPNFERYLEREQEVGFGYLFPLNGELSDYRLIYRSPAAILTVPVEYELTNIPLP